MASLQETECLGPYKTPMWKPTIVYGQQGLWRVICSHDRALMKETGTLRTPFSTEHAACEWFAVKPGSGLHRPWTCWCLVLDLAWNGKNQSGFCFAFMYFNLLFRDAQNMEHLSYIQFTCWWFSRDACMCAWGAPSVDFKLAPQKLACQYLLL